VDIPEIRMNFVANHLFLGAFVDQLFQPGLNLVDSSGSIVQ